MTQQIEQPYKKPCLIGSNASRLTVREIATFKYVWQLRSFERARLNVYFERRMQLDELADHLDMNKGKLFLSPYFYEPVQCDDAASNWNTATGVDVSYRGNFGSALFVALLKPYTSTTGVV